MATFDEAGSSTGSDDARAGLHAVIRSLAGAFAFATVLPVPAQRRAVGRGAITALPVVGAALGALAAARGVGGVAGLRRRQPAAGAARGRGAADRDPRPAHRRAVADTADGLGCYGPPERALEVMRDGAAGPFGVAAVVMAIVLQGWHFRRWRSPATGRRRGDRRGVAGRVAAVLACRRSVPAADGSSLGARAAGTQPAAVVLTGSRCCAALRWWRVRDRGRVRWRCWWRSAAPRPWSRTACAGSAGSPATCWAPRSS